LVKGGRRLLVKGRRPLIKGRRPLVKGRRPMVKGRRLSVEGGRPLVKGGRPLVKGGRPLVKGGRPLVEGGRRPLVKGRRLFVKGTPFVKGRLFVKSHLLRGGCSSREGVIHRHSRLFIKVVGREGRTMNFHVGKFKVQHDHMVLELVFKGPVHRTEKKTEIGLNRTDWDWTSGLFLDQSFAAWLLVFHFKKYCGTAKRPV